MIKILIITTVLRILIITTVLSAFFAVSCFVGDKLHDDTVSKLTDFFGMDIK